MSNWELLRANLPPILFTVSPLIIETNAYLTASFREANQKLKNATVCLLPTYDLEALLHFQLSCFCFQLFHLSRPNQCSSCLCWLMAHVSLQCIKKNQAVLWLPWAHVVRTSWGWVTNAYRQPWHNKLSKLTEMCLKFLGSHFGNHRGILTFEKPPMVLGTGVS